MYKTWDMRTGAAVVFLNFAEGSEIEKELNKCFIMEKEYAYYNKEESEELLKQGTITNSLVEKQKNGLLMVPNSKFVFAFYLELFSTDKDMVEKIHRLMNDFSENLHPGNASQVQYLFCYRQQWGKESLLTSGELAASIHKIVPNTLHAEYVLYSSMFVAHHAQEEALARYLHMLSRDTDAAKEALSFEQGYLCAFALEKYDVDTVESYDKEIRECRNWLQKEKDKDCKELCNKIVGHARGLVRGYYDMEGDFALLQGLYPRKADDYVRVSLFRHKLDTMSAPHIEEEKGKYEADYLEQLEHKADWEELKKWIRKNVTYPDFRHLLKEDARKVFIADVKNALKNEYNDPRYGKEIEQAVLDLYEKKITENLAELENWHKEVEGKLRQRQEDVEANGKYKDLTDCLASIRGNIRFTLPEGMSRQGCKEWLMFKEEYTEHCPGSGETEKCTYVYPDLRPWGVQLLSIARYNPEDNLLGQILKKGKGNERQD